MGSMSFRFGLLFRNVRRQLNNGNATMAIIVECIACASPEDGARVMRWRICMRMSVSTPGFSRAYDVSQWMASMREGRRKGSERSTAS
jgi:hypothetical protein